MHIFKTFGHKNTCLKCVIFTVSTLKYTIKYSMYFYNTIIELKNKCFISTIQIEVLYHCLSSCIHAPWLKHNISVPVSLYEGFLVCFLVLLWGWGFLLFLILSLLGQARDSS